MKSFVRNGVLALGVIVLVGGAFVGCAKKEEVEKGNIISTQETSADSMVSEAILLDSRNKYNDGECSAEGHIILKTEDNHDKKVVYALTMYGNYGFQNNNFVKVSGTGTIPAVISFEENDAGETISNIKWPEDGSLYTESIKNMFPKELHDRVLKISDEDSNNLTMQEKEYAKKYLTQINREAKIGNYRDFEHELLTDLGVSVEISNKRLELKEAIKYPDWIGTQEELEDGIRFVYETRYNKDKNEIIMAKYNYETKEIIEEIKMDSLKGNTKKLSKRLEPVGFAGCSLNRIELYSNGDVYWVQYDGEGLGFNNIIKDNLIVKNAKDIKLLDEGNINIIGDKLDIKEEGKIGWIKYN